MKKFYLIDGVRSVAALVVAVFHYNHFFQVPLAREAGYSADAHLGMWSFRHIFPIAAQNGGYAVMVFWTISGFVLSHVYSGRPHVGTGEYVINRFSRLYPLHFATLLCVAALQALAMRNTGGWLIYQDNTFNNFILQLGFVSNWRSDAPLTFNGPIWSVSVEVAIYIVFFLFIRAVRLNYVTAVGFIAALMIGVALTENMIPVSAVYFFFGCLAYLIYKDIRKRDRHTALLLSSGIVIMFCTPSVISANRLASVPTTISFGMICAAGLIFISVFEEMVNFNFYRRIGGFGNITYSAYLLHVPIQLVILLLAYAGYVSVGTFMKEWFLYFYIALVITAAIFVYRHFERPVQRFLRERTMKWTDNRARQVG